MMTNIRNITHIKGAIQVVLFLGLIINPVVVDTTTETLFSKGVLADDSKPKRKTKKTPALRERVYSQLARAQSLSDEDKVTEGLEVLDSLKSRINQLNSYERAILWNFYGFIYYNQEKTAEAVASFEKVVSEENIPDSLKISTLYSLAQLSMGQENYQKTIDYLNRWEVLKDDTKNENVLSLKANAFYAMKDYQSALDNITSAIKVYKSKSKLPKENWYVLQRALNYELGNKEGVLEVSKALVRHYSKDKYWLELANMYGELGQDELQLAVMEAAYQQGFVTKSSDIQSLAQLYYFSGAPFKSGNLLESAIKNQTIEADIKILKFLAQAWITAKETDKAIPVLKQAAELSSDGNMDARLAEVLLDNQQWQDAIKYAKLADIKGKLDNPGNALIIQGIAHYNLKEFNQAITHFKQARTEKKQQKIASQWLRYAERGIAERQRLVAAGLGS